MNGILKKIQIMGKDKTAKTLFQTEFKAGKGLPGDRHYDSDKDQITIFFDNSSVPHKDGLCTKRFKANLNIDIDEDTLISVGNELNINDTKLKLTKAKGCYDDCPLNSNGEKCHLVGNAFFAVVSEDGSGKVGDIVRTKK